MIRLEQLLHKFQPNNDFEFEGRHFKTNVPSVAPKAYLNIIFDAANDEVQEEIIDPLGLSDEIRAFYRAYNGASLLSESISIYGFQPKSYLIERGDWRKLPPYNIMDTNERYYDNVVFSRYLIFASYYPDRSKVFMERREGRVYCAVGDDLSRIRASWPSFEFWITEELERLSTYFDQHGNRLVELEDTLPGRT
jgi:hypothetical protein